ncbi:MAG: transporter [Mucilaginibacter sp.]
MKPGYLHLKLVLLIMVVYANAQAQDTTLNSYSLFKPIPRSLIRKSMTADRPDVSETPRTVDAGHFQYETDLVSYERERSGNEKQQHWIFNQANIKLGILKNTDFQAIVQTYGSDINQEPGKQKETVSGFGDITLRIKQCLYGNYSGNFSIALMPYVKIPTNTYNGNNLVEAGLIVPMLFELPNNWGIGTQVEGDYARDKDTPGYHAEFMQSLSIGHPLFKPFEIIAETYYTYNFKDHHIENFLNSALICTISNNVKLDAGLFYGLQRETTKTYFLGVAFRY